LLSEQVAASMDQQSPPRDASSSSAGHNISRLYETQVGISKFVRARPYPEPVESSSQPHIVYILGAILIISPHVRIDLGLMVN
jgi:hypothetical protein